MEKRHWSNIQLRARENYTGNALPKFYSNFYTDCRDEYGNQTEDEYIVGFFEITYPAWNITGRYEFDCGPYGGEPVVTVRPPNGVYYLTRIGSDYLSVNRAADSHENEERLREKAEGEIEILNGKLIRFTPHYDIFGKDHMKRIINCERSVARM